MNTVNADFCSFSAERVIAALEILENDNAYTNEHTALLGNKAKFTATLTQEQYKLYKLVIGSIFCVANMKEKAIYKQGFTDALRLLTTV